MRPVIRCQGPGPRPRDEDRPQRSLPCGSGLKWKKCTCKEYHPDL
ncbi:SEC-C metal-binding domain-containing protein [Gemmiger formicilis]|nr:SEC-C metal-binding domain-containing protein [Gemmiger formicilis]